MYFWNSLYYSPPTQRNNIYFRTLCKALGSRSGSASAMRYQTSGRILQRDFVPVVRWYDCLSQCYHMEIKTVFTSWMYITSVALLLPLIHYYMAGKWIWILNTHIQMHRTCYEYLCSTPYSIIFYGCSMEKNSPLEFVMTLLRHLIEFSECMKRISEVL